MKKDLRVIDNEFIRELRRIGEGDTALKLLGAYYKDIKKVGKQAYSDFLKKDRTIKRHLNRCVWGNCTDLIYKNFRCKKHYTLYKKYNYKETRTKYYQKNKDRIKDYYQKNRKKLLKYQEEYKKKVKSKEMIENAIK